jgi:hypothetical protein
VDHNVRLILIHDLVDTADEDWETAMHIASLRHGMTVPETRRRVRRKAKYSFHAGGMVQKVKYGYRKLTKEESASGKFGTPGLRIVKDDEDESKAKVFDKIRELAAKGYGEYGITHWLNDEIVEPGPYVETGHWTEPLVHNLLRDLILSGQRKFRTTVVKMVYRTGKSRRLVNVDGPERKSWPELAYMTGEQQASMIADLDAAKRLRSNNKKGRDHPLYNQPRSQTLWPGQQVRCGVCDGLMYRFGKVLKCRNAVANGPRTCWNHLLVPIAMVFDRVLPALVRFLDSHQGGRADIAASAWETYQQVVRQRSSSRSAVEREIGLLERQAHRISKAYIEGVELEAFVREAKTLDGKLAAKRRELARLDSVEDPLGRVQSVEEMADRIEEYIIRLATGSRSFADVLRKLIPRFVVQPVQALDRPQVRPRAYVTFGTAAWAGPGKVAREEYLTVDLFEPPDHVTALPLCLEARRLNPKASLKEIAAFIGYGHMTVKRAFDYAKLMNQAGMSEPYRILTEKPDVASRWRDPFRGPRKPAA